MPPPSPRLKSKPDKKPAWRRQQAELCWRQHVPLKCQLTFNGPHGVISQNLFKRFFSSGPHPTSYTVSTGSSFHGAKWQGHEADHSPPSNAEVKDVWSCISTPLYVFIVWCFVNYAEGQLYIYFVYRPLNHLFPWDFVLKIIFSPAYGTCPSHHVLLDLIISCLKHPWKCITIT
jgi:hypothetical protein